VETGCIEGLMDLVKLKVEPVVGEGHWRYLDLALDFFIWQDAQ
jgi:hypothetical protein